MQDDHVERRDAAHVVMSGETMVCHHCDARYTMNLPCPVSVFAAALGEFANIHRHCEEPPGRDNT